MDQNAELLMEIYKNSELERAVLGRLIRRCEDASFRNLMADHFTVYHTIMQEAHDELNTHGILAQEYGPFEKKTDLFFHRTPSADRQNVIPYGRNARAGECNRPD